MRRQYYWLMESTLVTNTLESGGTNAVAVNANQTRFISLGDAGTSWGATEASVQISSVAGVYSLMYMRTSSNTITASSTFTFRVNAGNGNQTFVYASGVSGEKQDTTHTDTVAANDLVNMTGVAGATGTSMILQLTGIVFSATTSTVKNIGNIGNTSNQTTNNATRYLPLAGMLINGLDTTEGNVQVKARTAMTLQNMSTEASTNTRTTNTVLRSRINAGNGNLVCTIGAAVITVVTDTTHTDSVASTDLINTSITFGASGENLALRTISVASLTTNSQFQFAGGKESGETVAAATTVNFKCGGDCTQFATESSTQQLASIAFTAQSLGINVITNTVTLNSTFKFRINGTDGNQVATIALSLGGYDEDTTHTDTVLATDEINYQMITGATGVSLVFGAYGMVGVIATASTNNKFLYMF